MCVYRMCDTVSGWEWESGGAAERWDMKLQPDAVHCSPVPDGAALRGSAAQRRCVRDASRAAAGCPLRYCATWACRSLETFFGWLLGSGAAQHVQRLEVRRARSFVGCRCGSLAFALHMPLHDAPPASLERSARPHAKPAVRPMPGSRAPPAAPAPCHPAPDHPVPLCAAQRRCSC